MCQDHWARLNDDLRRDVVAAQRSGNQDACFQAIYDATLYLEGNQHD